MNRITFTLLYSLLSAFAGQKSGEDVLQDMYSRYAGKWYRTFSFNQTTVQYKNDSIVKTSTWYEAIALPDKFRIDFGEKQASNAVIYSKDSVYSFRKGKLMRCGLNDDDLTFLLGGMYFYDFNTVKFKIKQQGYDPGKCYEDHLNGQPVFVIGAAAAGEKSNQLWIDKEKLVVLKFVRYKKDEKEEGIFGGHQRFGNSWSETSCDFYINEKLVQHEQYHDCKADEYIDPAIFDPHHFKVRE